jgi:hypothetical protein
VTETTYVVAVTLLAVLVGALLPVLYQLMQTLRSTRRVLTQMESHAKELKPAVEAASEIGTSVKQMRSSLKTTASVASTLVPYLVTLLRALRSEADEGDEARPGKGAAGETGAKGTVPPTFTEGIGKEERHHGN